MVIGYHSYHKLPLLPWLLVTIATTSYHCLSLPGLVVTMATTLTINKSILTPLLSGTLTEEGLTLHCVLSVNSGVFSEEQTINIDQHLRGALSCCHSLSVINDKICGDPIDLIGQHASGSVHAVFILKLIMINEIMR